MQSDRGAGIQWVIQLLQCAKSPSIRNQKIFFFAKKLLVNIRVKNPFGIKIKQNGRRMMTIGGDGVD